MAYSKEMIYNITLNNLGVSAVIQNTTETNPRTTVLNNQYELAKEQVMKDFDWNFLNRIRELTPSTEESPDPRFHYAYDYPNDCIAARYLIDPYGGQYKKFEVTTDSTGSKIIVCNIKPAKLSYTRDIASAVPETYFTSEFVSALCFYLAFLCAETITGATDKKQSNYQAYQYALAKAKAMNANESTEKDEDETTYLDARN